MDVMRQGCWFLIYAPFNAEPLYRRTAASLLAGVSPAPHHGGDSTSC